MEDGGWRMEDGGWEFPVEAVGPKNSGCHRSSFLP